MTEFEKFVLFLTPLISLTSLLLGWLRWKGGEKAVSDSNAVENFSKAANTTADLNQRLQQQIEEHLKDKLEMQAQLDEGRELIAQLRAEREDLLREHEKWQDNNIELAKRVGVLSKNYEGLQREMERIRTWGYANASEVLRLGGTPIKLEDVR